jgi:hypothetical protein
MWYYELPNLKSIHQVYHDSGSTKVLKTYAVDHAGHEENKQQMALEVQAFTTESWEMSFGLTVSKNDYSSTFKSYVDDSLKMVNRPIYNTKINIKRANDHELYGLFTYPCVHGGMLSEIPKDKTKNQHNFSWANSNSMGCTMSADMQVLFYIFRNIQSNDNKGISELYIDQRVTYSSFIFRL